MASKSSFRLALLGGFCLSQGSRVIEVAASGQRLIALLALTDRPAARLYLAGMLWPDYSTERSLADLRTTLWRLNQSGEPLIEATHSCLALSDHIDVDVRRLVAFAQHLHAPEAGSTGAGSTEIDLNSVRLAELCGELLPDWYEEWLVDERERLRQIRLHALEKLSGLLSRAGQHSDAIQAALAAIRLEPLRETAHRALIEAHLAEGNWSEARRQFHRCQRLFRAELGVEPTASMRRLLEPSQPAVPRQSQVFMPPARRELATPHA
jgi:DNA-binding SARP family transcriptional activator